MLRAGNRRIAQMVLAALVVVALGGLLLYRVMTVPVESMQLPPLPDLGGERRAMAKHIREADRAARRRADSAEAVAHLGVVYHGNGFYEHALACYERAAELAPGDWRWHYYRALIHWERTETEAAVEAFRAALELNPGYAPGWYFLGEAEVKRGRSAEARVALEKAIEADRSFSWPMEEWQVPMSTPPVSAYARVALARMAQLEERPEEAALILEEVVREYPEFRTAQRLLAGVYRQLGRDEEAEKHFAATGALETHVFSPPVDPLFDEVMEESRSSTFLLKHAERAIRALEGRRALFYARRAVESDPRDAEACRVLGFVLVTVERVEEAREHLERYIEMSPPEVNAAANVGELLLGLKMDREAIPYFARALKMRPENASVHNKLGALYQRQGDLARAAVHYREAVRLEPDLVQARASLAEILAASGQIDEALAECRKTLEYGDDSQVRVLMGEILFSRGQTDEAIRHFLEAIRLRPTLSRAHKRLGDALILDRPREALAAYEKAVELDPGDRQARYGLAYLYNTLGRPADAVGQLREAVRRGGNDAQSLNLLARALATHPEDSVRSGAEAVQMAEKAASLTGSREPAVLDTLAAAYAEAGRFADAVGTARKALDLARGANQADLARQIESHLRLYENSQPYRERPY